MASRARRWWRSLLWTLAVTATATAAVVMIFSAPAEAKLTISGSSLRTEIEPGEPYEHKITIRLDEGDPSLDFVVEVLGLGQDPDGSSLALAPAADTSSYSAREYINVDKTSFHLRGGESTEVIATVNLPPESGGRYASVQVRTVPSQEEGVSLGLAGNIIMVLTISDSELIHEGTITALEIEEIASGEPIKITTAFYNSGNHHFKVQGEVTVHDQDGAVLTNILIPPTTGSILPHYSRQLDVVFDPEDALDPGDYFVRSRVTLEDGTVLDDAEAIFTLQESYLPSVPSAPSQKLVVGGAAVVLAAAVLWLYTLFLRKKRSRH